MNETPCISLAFRFHVNFYHSYRGDTPDEKGFGKDIRIIRRIIQVLDGFNEEGIPVRGTWDIENYYSLEKIIPEYCPDILKSWQRRSAAGLDEFELMSYNNGLLSASTQEEFDRAVAWSDTNPAGSGLKDLFGSYAPVVRPQEMMYTPGFIKAYAKHGIDTLSLYYSAIPFTAFTCFVPPLPPEQRYNPLRLTAPGFDGYMNVIPAYNHGDLVDNLSLRRWVKRMRKQQLALEKPVDFLLLIDLDADDEFWLGMDVPLLKKGMKVLQGLPGLVKSLRGLDYVRFDTPWNYLQSHPPAGTVSVGQDTADGSFDGYSSWAEKWSNHQLWTSLDRSRLCARHARRLLEGGYGRPFAGEIEGLLEESLRKRVLLLSTTHFGMAAPVVNAVRLRSAGRLAAEAHTSAMGALKLARGDAEKVGGQGKFRLLYGPRPEGTVSSRQLLRLRLGSPAESGDLVVVDRLGGPVPSGLSSDGKELLIIAPPGREGEEEFRLSRGAHEAPGDRLEVSDRRISGPGITVLFDDDYECVYVGSPKNESPQRTPFMQSGLTYAGKTRVVRRWEVTRREVSGGGLFALLRTRGEVDLPGLKGGGMRVEREFLAAAGLPYLFLTVRVTYPRTPHLRYDREKAERLGQTWDNRWQEVFPCRLFPDIRGTSDRPLRVWKHNYFGDVSYYDLDYGRYSRNRELDSFNNHVTRHWAALSDGGFGLLVGQTPEVLSNMAFCPMRLRHIGGFDRVFLNPFGTWYGRQPFYPTAYTGLGRLAAVKASASDHLRSCAPSYNGRRETFRLLLAPYAGDAPPEDLQAAAAAFAEPPLLVDSAGLFVRPGWEGILNFVEEENPDE